MRLLIRSLIEEICFETCKHRNMIPRRYVPEIAKRAINEHDLEIVTESSGREDIEIDILVSHEL